MVKPGVSYGDSAALAQAAASVEMTLFEFHARTQRLLDLTQPPLAAQRAGWIAQDYGATQALAAGAREADIEAVRYESTRDKRTAAAWRCWHRRCLVPTASATCSRPGR